VATNKCCSLTPMWTTGGGRFKVVTEPISAEERVTHRAPGESHLWCNHDLCVPWPRCSDQPTRLGSDGQLMTPGHP
jgi:hypothetical protein